MKPSVFNRIFLVTLVVAFIGPLGLAMLGVQGPPPTPQASSQHASITTQRVEVVESSTKTEVVTGDARQLCDFSSLSRNPEVLQPTGFLNLNQSMTCFTAMNVNVLRRLDLPTITIRHITDVPVVTVQSPAVSFSATPKLSSGAGLLLSIPALPAYASELGQIGLVSALILGLFVASRVVRIERFISHQNLFKQYCVYRC